MRERSSFLPGEISQGTPVRGICNRKTRSVNPCSDVRLNCEKSAEVIVPEVFFLGRTEQKEFHEFRKGEDKQRMQKTRHESGLGCSGEDRVEPEGSQRAQSVEALEQKERNGTDELLEQLVSRDNLNTAYRKVKRNGGAAGIDGMTVEEMLPYLKEHKEELIQKIRVGKYKPKPVRRVEIPKSGGGKRQLGIPTVVDRMIQQALVQVLTPIFEPTFSDGSFGFRPGRSAHEAIRKTKEYYEEGYRYVVDLDMEKLIGLQMALLLLRMPVKSFLILLRFQ